MPNDQGVLLDWFPAHHMFSENLAYFVIGQRDIFHRRLSGKFNGGHWLLATESGATRGGYCHILQVGFGHLFHDRIHDAAGACCDATSPHMHRDLGSKSALSQSLM